MSHILQGKKLRLGRLSSLSQLYMYEFFPVWSFQQEKMGFLCLSRPELFSLTSSFSELFVCEESSKSTLSREIKQDQRVKRHLVFRRSALWCSKG